MVMRDVKEEEVVNRITKMAAKLHFSGDRSSILGMKVSASGAESESKDPKTDRLDILLYRQIKYRKGDWFLAATFNRLSKPFLPNIVRHI